jgi:hypothetical protein
MSQTATAASDQTAPLEVTDSLGRKLKVQKLDILKELDLIEAAGKAADNNRWMMLATLAACVIEVDGVPIPPPTTREKIRAQVARVRAEGIDAVAEAFKAQLPEDGEGAAASSEEIAKN